MDENELEVVLEKEDVEYEDQEEDLNGNEHGILCGLLEDFATHEGGKRLVSNYRVVLRVLEDPAKVDSKTLKTALKVISEGLGVAHGEVTAAGSDVTKLSREQWKAARTTSITLLFLFYKAMTNVESKFFAEQHNLSVVAAVQPNRRRGKKATPRENSNYPFWEEYRQTLVIQMNRLLKCPLEKLWPSAANFFRGVTIAVCQVIANPTARLINDPDLVDYLFDVLGQLCSRYEEETGVINRLVPLIKNSEDTAKVVAHGLNRLNINFERDRVVFNAVREVLTMYNNQLERETPAERSVATFLQEIAVLNPRATIRALPCVFQFLESESSSIRGAVLTVAAELLTWSKVPDATVEAPRSDDDQTDFDTLRDDVLHHLLNHIRDTNALVRNKALQLCTRLITQGSLYLPEIVQCAEQGRRRLMDKAVTTRKIAINLISAAVYADPVVIKFSADEFRKQIRGLREELIAFISKDLPLDKKIKAVVQEFIALISIDKLEDIKLPPHITDPQGAIDHLQALLKDGDIYEACKFLYTALQEFIQHPDFKPFEKEMSSRKMYIKFFRKILDVPLDDSMEIEPEDGIIEDAAVIESDQTKTKRHYLKYMENCHSLSRVMESALPHMTILLELGTAADKTEVIECFAVLTESGYKLEDHIMGGIIEAVAQMDPSSRKELMESIWRIFLKGCTTEHATIARLFEILEKLSGSQKEHFAVLVQGMVRNKTITNEHFQILWDAYGLTNPTWSPKVSKHAAFILGIVGRTHPAVITSNISYLIDVGLGARGLEDFPLVKNTCEALMLLCPKPPKNPDEDTEGPQIVRFPLSHVLYEKLVAVILHGLSKKLNSAADSIFQKTCELIMQLIYRTCLEPKKVVLELLEKMHKIVFGSETQDSEIHQTERVICRYLNFVTALLGAHVFYYENVVLSEVKRRKKIASTSSQGNKGKKKPSRKNQSIGRSRNATSNSSIHSNANSTMHSTASGSVTNGGNVTEVNEMDVIIGNIGYDVELETVRAYLEQIIMKPGAFRQMRIHTLFVASKLATFKSVQLKIAAVRALAKIMSISSKSVADNSDVFLSLWKMVKKAEVRCELIRAAILLNVRYPNQMEKCNNVLLEGLQDPEDCIRMATVDFITFLALNDLVKIREQLTDVATCLIDPNVDVREMAKDFLDQCGEKDNMLSNALPDILSRLSSREDIEQEQFQQIMKFLLARVKKDKMLLGFIEKLILRFRIATKGRQCQDVAYCLNQLTFNDKSFKIIKENFMAYHDKLGDEYVFDAFNTIVQNLRKTAKHDFKLKLDELEKDLVLSRGKCQDKERMEEAAGRKAASGQAPAESSDDDFVDDGEEDNSKEDQEENSSNQGNTVVENGGAPLENGHAEQNGHDKEDAPMNTASSSDDEVPIRSSRRGNQSRSTKAPTPKPTPLSKRGRARTTRGRGVKAEPESLSEQSSDMSDTTPPPPKAKTPATKSKPAPKAKAPAAAAGRGRGRGRGRQAAKPEVESDNEDPEEHPFSDDED